MNYCRFIPACCMVYILFVDDGSSVDDDRDVIIVGGVGISTLVLMVIVAITVLCVLK